MELISQPVYSDLSGEYSPTGCVSHDAGDTFPCMHWYDQRHEPLDMHAVFEKTNMDTNMSIHTSPFGRCVSAGDQVMMSLRTILFTCQSPGNTLPCCGGALKATC